MIEKDITLDKRLPGRDHAASLGPDEFAELVSAIRNVEKALGDGRKVPHPSEGAVRDVARKSIVAKVEMEESMRTTGSRTYEIGHWVVSARK